MRQEKIRNFSIIAHIDHGKSTLANRFLQLTGAVSPRDLHDRVLDDMDLEQERGITIKARAVSMNYDYKDETYHLNLIDTPGHVDFSYEVSRSLNACEGVLLLVDATQGVQAQTVANAYLSIEHDLAIIPVVSKMDVAGVEPQTTIEEIEKLLGGRENVQLCSARTGQGVEDVLAAVIERIPPPSGDADAPLRALIFDSVYDDYRGVILYLRIVDGRVNAGDTIKLYSTGSTYEVAEVGRFAPRRKPCGQLAAGDVGYLVCGLKDLHEVRVGDTVIHGRGPRPEPLPGYKPFKPMVFCGLFPAIDSDFDGLKRALEKLYLNDPAFVFQQDRSQALGLGFRCGFLGMLHMEIVQERIERESGIVVIKTAPSVSYKAVLAGGETVEVNNPAETPDASRIEKWLEPVALLHIITPDEYIGTVMRLMEERRALFGRTEYIGRHRVMMDFRVPFMEIAYDFFGRLKSCTRGYATMDYEITGYEEAELAKLDILVNGTPVDALSIICHRSDAEKKGRRMVERLKKEIPRHLFRIPLQAAIGGRIVARENISALAKNVTAKCYGGDITRKRKLLDRQKEGKKRMRAVGDVRIPQEAFMAILSSEDE
ncbi:MAG TPA: elongation factor 4 [Planctomycetes bacterium]|nr:elongation factor 4 [Planctomycetota bacterium]